ncbi:MAG TPA: hypothetical protein IAA56_02405, partial [Candidatus Galloscillospira excrementavium]|nr:hypothetical protein [Candidatus Galloscillospira excrementavium]
MERTKMVKTAKVFDKLLRILQKIMIICAAVCVAVLGILTVINIINHDFVVGEVSNRVDIGPLTFELAEEAALDSHAVLVYAWIMVVAAVAVIAVACYVI